MASKPHWVNKNDKPMHLPTVSEEGPASDEERERLASSMERPRMYSRHLFFKASSSLGAEPMKRQQYCKASENTPRASTNFPDVVKDRPLSYKSSANLQGGVTTDSDKKSSIGSNE